jgi:protein gp37
MKHTKIEWCDMTWNPVWGCKNNCEFCYARKINDRFKIIKDWNNPEWMENNFNKKFPKEPSRIFVNSMSDIAFWQDDWMGKILNKIKDYPQHQFLFLTKFASTYDDWDFYNNCWLGTTITNQERMNAFANLIFDTKFDQQHKIFVSIEPIMTAIKMYVDFDWVIVGAETGNRKDKVIPKKEWIEDIRKHCEKNNIPYFEKNSLQKIVDRPLIQQFPK